MENTSPFQAAFIAPTDFSLDMLKELHLGFDLDAIAAKYGLVYEQIKELPHFKRRMEQVELALRLDGSLTSVVAGAGLHAAVEKLAFRVQDDRIPTGDLVKAIEAFKKVKDGAKSNEDQTGNQGVSLVINIPAMGEIAAKTVEITTEPNKKLKEYNTIEAEVTAVDEEIKSRTPSFEINV
jgi:hypothetical protein